MKTLIKNGLVVDPANLVQTHLNLLLEDGKDDGKATAESEFPLAGQIKKIGPPPALPGEGPCGERIQQPL